jgi:uroporphyrinogen-III synthase
MIRPAIAVVGAETARAVQAAGLQVARQPADQRQEGLVAMLEDLPAGNPCALSSGDGRPRGARHGAASAGCVQSTSCPRRKRPRVEICRRLPAFDVATFASPSALEAFVKAHGTGSLGAAPVVAIGPTTAAAARALGLSPLVATSPSVAG